MLLSADRGDQLSDGAWVTRAATLGVVTRTSLTQAVPGRSRQHWRHRATSQSGPECITGRQVRVESTSRENVQSCADDVVIGGTLSGPETPATWGKELILVNNIILYTVRF